MKPTAIPVPADPMAENAAIAAMLREASSLLAAQGANAFRHAAYRKAADTVAALSSGVRGILERQGRAGLDALPAIGPGIAGAISEILVSGHWSQLDHLRGEVDSGRLFQSVPGIGPALAQRIQAELGIHSLEDLETAARDGSLARVGGIGPWRARAIGAALTEMLDRTRAARRPAPPPVAAPAIPVAVILDVDREYRSKASAGKLPKIAPRRMNPQGEAWLPVLHAQRGSWHFTALFSNTVRAHELHRERDWVVIYFHDGDQVERQHTVVTETRGGLVGRRVVRGREAECRAYYERRGASSADAAVAVPASEPGHRP
jgi:hypothetical protein